MGPFVFERLRRKVATKQGNLRLMSKSDSNLRWLPKGKTAAICLSIDDVHPGTSDDAYEAGGDLGDGALCHVEQLLRDHPQLQATLFVTPDWRPLGLVPRRTLLTHVPLIRNYVYWTTLQPKDHLRIDRHADFVAHINGLQRVETAMHGLHHLHRGPNFAVEFQRQSKRQCLRMLDDGLEIFESAGMDHVSGFQPPAWNLPDNLVDALADSPLQFVSSARDLVTAVAPDARTNMSGLKNVSLIFPQWLREKRLLHMTSNFQATSDPQRAMDIIDAGGLLAIKAHIFKCGGGHTMLDGLDANYRGFLSELFSTLDDRYGDALWWTSMGDIAKQMYKHAE